MFFLSSNFSAFQQEAVDQEGEEENGQVPAWSNLTKEHRAHVHAHRWPPTSYFAAVKKHQRDVLDWEMQCKVIGKKKKVRCSIQ